MTEKTELYYRELEDDTEWNKSLHKSISELTKAYDGSPFTLLTKKRVPGTTIRYYYNSHTKRIYKELTIEYITKEEAEKQLGVQIEG